MVVDWKKQIDECIKNTCLMPIFHAMPIEQRLQEIYVTKRLMSMNYDNQKILNWFLLAEEDCLKTMYDIETLVELAKKRKNPRSHDFTVYITNEEITFIDSLDADKECKSFLLAAVAFAKTMNIKRKRPTFNARERSYIYYLATGSDDYFKNKKRAKYIQAFLRKLFSEKIITTSEVHNNIKIYTGHRGGSVKVITNVILKAKWINWDASEGYTITKLEPDVKLLCDQMVHHKTMICEKCGKAFIVSNKTHRKMCDECYKLYRQEYKKDPKYHLQWNKHKDKAGTANAVNLH